MAIGTPIALTSKAFGGTNTVSQSITLTTGDLFVLVFEFGSTRTITSVKWNTIALNQDAAPVTFSTTEKMAIYSLYITSGATATYDVVVSGTANGICYPLRITGIASSSWLDQIVSALTATTTAPTSGATPTTTQATEIAIGVMARQGTSVGGSWSNSFTDLSSANTGANGVIDVGYLQLSTTGAQTAAKTGCTNSIYAAACVTYKGVAAGDIAAVMAGTSTFVANLQGAGALAAVIPGSSTFVANLTGRGDLAASIPGTSTFVANLTGVGNLAAAIAGTSTFLATLQGAGALLANIAGTSTFLGNLQGLTSLVAVLSGTSTFAADLRGAGALACVLAGTSTFTAGLKGLGFIRCSMPGTSTFVCNLGGLGSLNVVITGTSTFVAGLSSLAGSIQVVLGGTSTFLANLTNITPLAPYQYPPLRYDYRLGPLLPYGYVESSGYIYKYSVERGTYAYVEASDFTYKYAKIGNFPYNYNDSD